MQSQVPVALRCLSREGQVIPSDADVVIVPVGPPDGKHPEGGVSVADADVALLAGWGVDLHRRLARHSATGARTDSVWIDLERDSPLAVLAVGVGSGSAMDLRRQGGATARKLRGRNHVVDLVASGLDPEQLRAWCEGLVLGSVGFTMATAAPPRGIKTVTMLTAKGFDAQGVLDNACVHAEATLLARRLIATPSNIKSPKWMVKQLAGLAEQRNLTAHVWGVADLKAQGFGGILAVGHGSARPPRVVQLDFVPESQPERHVVLVGKGITFDSGGLSLKKPDMQVPMKTDMSGAAVVGSVMTALNASGVADVRVTALLCLAENMPGSGAYRPGDVVGHFGGMTSEVLNTDAEGRLVLADGLAYAAAVLRPDVIVDVATLTGAATMGLGRRYGALFTNRSGLTRALADAGADAGEPLWPMPLFRDYAPLIESRIADQSNADVAGGPGPGAITAALFLSRFVGDIAWGHMDIAGPGRSDSEHDELPKGGTGFGVRALLRWICAGAPS